MKVDYIIKRNEKSSYNSQISYIIHTHLYSNQTCYLLQLQLEYNYALISYLSINFYFDDKSWVIRRTNNCSCLEPDAWPYVQQLHKSSLRLPWSANICFIVCSIDLCCPTVTINCRVHFWLSVKYCDYKYNDRYLTVNIIAVFKIEGRVVEFPTTIYRRLLTNRESKPRATHCVYIIPYLHAKSLTSDSCIPRDKS